MALTGILVLVYLSNVLDVANHMDSVLCIVTCLRVHVCTGGSIGQTSGLLFLLFIYPHMIFPSYCLSLIPRLPHEKALPGYEATIVHAHTVRTQYQKEIW